MTRPSLLATSMCWMVLTSGLLIGRPLIGADVAEVSLARSKLLPPRTDATLDEAVKLKIGVPIMCREWHVWWGSPHGVRPMTPAWVHWDGLKRLGQFDPTTTIEEAVLGVAWRRNLNSVGYPLLGPYDPSQPDIIRWQLETARSAGLDCLHVHLWPSIYDDGSDFGPLPLFERILETAEKLNYPVGVHDEVMFRGPEISQAQKLDSSIRRLSSLVKRYGNHPGWRKIDGMPLIYFQNWNKWISAEDMQTLFAEVEKRSQPVYWIVEMSPEEDYLSVPQLKAFLGPSNSYFLHTPPFGQKPHPWNELEGGMQHACELARKHGKKVGLLVFTRFNNHNDRGVDGRDVIDADDGMFYIDSLRRAAELKPDFLVISQWNDFEESGFIEPAWDYDGWNGDPYRYCRITAAAMNKSFKPAQLPKREELDPWMRRKLFGDSQPGDQGPLLYNVTVKRGELQYSWGEGSGDPAKIKFVQDGIQAWSVAQQSKSKIRQANRLADDELGIVREGQELRFYSPGIVMDQAKTIWLGVRVTGDSSDKLRILYRGDVENYRWDSHDDRRHVSLDKSARFDMKGERIYWMPLYAARFAGFEGDLTFRMNGDGRCAIKELFVWQADMQGISVDTSWKLKSLKMPARISSTQPFVVVAFDKLNNPGLPRLMIDGKTLPNPSRDPMDLLK